MKKITLLLFIFLNFIGWSQTYKFHTLQDLGPNIETAISAECAKSITVGPNRDVNLNQSFKLEVGEIYKSDLVSGSTSGSRYYKVLYAVDYYLDKGAEIDEPADFELIPDLCNSLSWKYIRPILLGSTIQEAQTNFCSNLTINTTRERVNVRTEKPLNIGDVYLMNFGKGANYYLITASDLEAGDSEYQLDSTNDNSIFSLIAFNCQKPDPQAVSIAPETNNDNYYRGSGIRKRAYFHVTNIGADIVNSNTVLTLYLTASRNFVNGNDIKLVASGLNREDVNNGVVSALIYNIPYNASIGNYFLTLEITNTEDFNVYNNIVSSASRITVKDGTPPTTPTPTPTPTPTGKPDLIIDSDKTFISSDCGECSSIPLSELKDKRHKINNQSGYITLPFIAVKNIGNSISSPTNVTFYLSSNTTLDSADLKSNGTAIKINGVKSGESYVVSGGTIFPSDFSNTGTTFQNNWNILMVVDDSKTITESNENNNVTVIPVIFYNPFAKTAPATLVTNEQVEPYSMNVYNFEGQKVLTKEVSSKDEENKSLDSLKSGIYIIKSKNETRKVIK